jgi:hypothetical protein
MALNEETMKIVEHADRTGHGCMESVREVWSRLNFSAQDVEDLMQEAMAVRVGDVLRSSHRRDLLERSLTPAIMVGVQVVERGRQVYDVNVDVLERVSWDINGRRVRLIDLTVLDAEHLIERCESSIRGQLRHVGFYRYIKAVLEGEGKQTVRECNQAEQFQIAMRLKALEAREQEAVRIPPRSERGGMGRQQDAM